MPLQWSLPRLSDKDLTAKQPPSANLCQRRATSPAPRVWLQQMCSTRCVEIFDKSQWRRDPANGVGDCCLEACCLSRHGQASDGAPCSGSLPVPIFGDAPFPATALPYRPATGSSLTTNSDPRRAVPRRRFFSTPRVVAIPPHTFQSCCPSRPRGRHGGGARRPPSRQRCRCRSCGRARGCRRNQRPLRSRACPALAASSADGWRLCVRPRN